MKREIQDSKNSMQRLFKPLLLSFTFMLLMLNSASALIHPGGWLTQDELTLIRTKVAAQEEPWYSAWLAMENVGAGTSSTTSTSIKATVTSQSIFQSDGDKAYVLAIKWVASGNQAYATAATDIIDDWVNTVTGFNHGNTPLRQGIAANKMANAAEILAWGFNGGAGWSSSKINNAKTWFENVVYPVTSTGDSRSQNWGTACQAANMSMAVFCNKTSMFDDAVDSFKNGFTNTTDGCAAVTDYIINSDGQCYESGRDQSHTMGGLAHLVEPAMIAWNQGTDLVSYSNNRLVAGLEYTAKFNLGNTVSFTTNIPNPCNNNSWTSAISIVNRGDFSPIFVMAHRLFEKAGKSHPYTEDVLEASYQGTAYVPEPSNSDHPGLGTLTLTPDGITAGKTYYIDNPYHNKRLGANGGESAYTTSTSTTGSNVEWVISNSSNSGYYYIDCNGGGSKPRIRTDNTEFTDMQSTSSAGSQTRWEITDGDNDAFLLTTEKSGFERLQVNNSGQVKMVTSTSTGVWEQFTFTEVTNPSGRITNELGLSTKLENSELTVYPNPVSTSLTILNPKSVYNQYSIYNMGGKVIRQDQIANDVTELSIDLNKLNGGVYILELKSETAVKKIKLLKN